MSRKKAAEEDTEEVPTVDEGQFRPKKVRKRKKHEKFLPGVR